MFLSQPEYWGASTHPPPCSEPWGPDTSGLCPLLTCRYLLWLSQEGKPQIEDWGSPLCPAPLCLPVQSSQERPPLGKPGRCCPAPLASAPGCSLGCCLWAGAMGPCRTAGGRAQGQAVDLDTWPEREVSSGQFCPRQRLSSWGGRAQPTTLPDLGPGSQRGRESRDSTCGQGTRVPAQSPHAWWARWMDLLIIMRCSSSFLLLLSEFSLVWC